MELTIKKQSTTLLIGALLVATLLRLINIGNNPPALYWDEASIGYNAYSILTAGIDEHGVRYPITHFLAYGDAKPPLYIYATSLMMSLVGVTEWAVRLPSALAGIVAVWLTYAIALKVLSNRKEAQSVALISAWLMAISPWHVFISRVGYEANLALTLFLGGMVAYLHRKQNPKWLLLTAVLFVLTWYTFNAYRIFIPLLLVFLAVFDFRYLLTQKKWVGLAIGVAALLTAPLVPFILSGQAQLRFEEVTIFNNHDPVIEANVRQELNDNAWWTKIVYNRRVFFALEFLKHYTDHVKPEFLFFFGDVNPRLSVKDMGVLYWIELPLLLMGIYALVQKEKRSLVLLAGWALLAIVPAGIARETPHALRSLQLLPVPYLVIGSGIVLLVSKLPKLKIPLILGYALCVGIFLQLYHFHYPFAWSSSWQYGYKELVSYIDSVDENYDRVYVTSHHGRPHTYLLFYLQYDPGEYVANRDAGGDAFGFTETRSFDKYYFTEVPSQQPTDEKWLIIDNGNAADDVADPEKIIYNLNNEPVFVGYTLE